MDRSCGDPLQGLIEVDETYIGGTTPGNRPRGRSTKEKALVVGAAELRGKHIGRIRLRVAAQASAPELLTFAQGRDFQNQPNASRLSPRVHRVFGLLNRWLLGTLHGAVSRKHLQRYLDEFVFRFNRRASANRLLLFGRLVTKATRTPRQTYTSIVGRAPPGLVAA